LTLFIPALSPPPRVESDAAAAAELEAREAQKVVSKKSKKKKDDVGLDDLLSAGLEGGKKKGKK